MFHQDPASLCNTRSKSLTSSVPTCQEFLKIPLHVLRPGVLGISVWTMSAVEDPHLYELHLLLLSGEPCCSFGTDFPQLLSEF